MAGIPGTAKIQDRKEWIGAMLGYELTALLFCALSPFAAGAHAPAAAYAPMRQQPANWPGSFRMEHRRWTR